MTTLNFDDPTGVAAGCEAICYYLNLRLVAKKTGKDTKLPEAVGKIVELAETLTKPELSDWSAQAHGKLPGTKSKPKAASAAAQENGDGEAKRSRGQWTAEKKDELVKLVENEDFRKEILGNNALVWASMARHFGFAKANPLQRQYQAMTGRDPPGMRAKKEASGDGEGAPAAKKAKVEAPMSSDGWSGEKATELRKLVEDAAYRKAKTGKNSLKWSRIAEYLDKDKKDCKKKFCSLTGMTKEALENLS